MDIVQAVSGYITKMVSAGDNATTGTSAAKMKILLLDSETVGLSTPAAILLTVANVAQVTIVSTATTQSALLNHEVYLTEYLPRPPITSNNLTMGLAVWMVRSERRCAICVAFASFGLLPNPYRT